MNPAGRVRCNMRKQIELSRDVATQPNWRQVRRWSVGLFIGAQYLTGLRIDYMDLPAN